MDQYYFMKMDERIKRIIGLDGIMNQHFTGEQPIIQEIENGDNGIYTDFIRHRINLKVYYIISDLLRDVFVMYNDCISCRPVILTDIKNKTQKLYFQAFFEEKNEHVYIAKKGHLQFLVVSIYVVESILRRQLIGIQFENAILHEDLFRGERGSRCQI